MSFQTTVRYDKTYGVPGEIAKDGPTISEAGLLNSANAAYNIIGATAFTQPAAGGAVVAGGVAGQFFGILAQPKNQASYGTQAGGPLAATLTLANNVLASFVKKTAGIVISVAAACNIGDKLTYNTTTGALGTVAPSAGFTGVIAATTGVLTVSAVGSTGNIGIGSVINDASGNILGTVTSLGSGTGGNGTYNLTGAAAAGVASSAMSAVSVAPTGTAIIAGATIIEYAQSGAGLAVAQIV